MKKILLIVLFITGVCFGQTTNPCEDERYIVLKNKSLDDMSDREYEYFIRKDKECSQYLGQLPLRSPGNQPSTKSKKTIYKQSSSDDSSQTETINLDGETVYLTSKQKQRFIRERLTVEVFMKTSGGTTAMPIGKTGMYYGASNAITTRGWNAYKGLSQISEENFLRTAGYNTEANVVKNYKSINTSMSTIGCVAIVVSFVMLLSTTDAENSEADNQNLVFGIIGGVGFFAGLLGSVNAAKNYYQYVTIKDISVEYNKKLIKTIKMQSD